MILQLTSGNLLLWAFLLIFGFPILAISLGEIGYRLQRQGKPLAATILVVRNLVLPVLVLLLAVKQVLQLSPDDKFVKSTETLFWICVIHAALSLLNAVLFEQAKAGTWRARVPKLLIDLFRFLLVLMGTGLVLATVWKADLAGLVTALGVSSIVIGLALQDTLGSVMSGIALLFERPFTVGDWLRIEDLVGQVIDINWRAVRLQTLEREMVVIPHKFISGAIIRNFSQPVRLHAERIRVGFSYSDPPNLAKYVLRTTALETQGILSQPEPEIFTISYDDSSITYEVKFYLEDYGQLEQIRDRFMTRVWYAAQRNSLTIPFPIRTLYHFHGPTSKAEGTSKKLAESLQSIPSFIPLDKQTPLGSAAEGITHQHFGAGEKVIQQSSHDNCLYIILSGQALITVTDEMNQEHSVLPLKSGEFFGEMTLSSEEASPISVTALDDLEVLRISAGIVNQMIDRQPSFAREIGQILEIRRRAIHSLTHSSTHS